MIIDSTKKNVEKKQKEDELRKITLSASDKKSAKMKKLEVAVNL